MRWWWLGVVVGCEAPQVRPPCAGAVPGAETVRVDLAGPREPHLPLFGLLHGSSDAQPLHADLARPLAPVSWRTSAFSEHDRYADLSDRVVYVVPDGAPVPQDDPRGWAEHVAATVTDPALAHVDDWDLGSEPNWTWGATTDEWQDAVLDGIEVVRATAPGARVVAPSVGPAPGDTSFDLGLVLGFVDALAERGATVDALSWHEFFAPQEVIAHASEVRAHAGARLGAVPELHVNEFGGPAQFLIPGFGVAWLAALHEAGVTLANRACWDVPDRIPWNSCFEGLEGLASRDGTTPQPAWHVHAAYARLAGDRLPLSGDGLAEGLATEDRDGTVRVLVGRADRASTGEVCRSGDAELTLRLDGLPPGSFVAAVEAIPEGAPGEPLPSPLPSHERVVQVGGSGSLVLALGSVGDGDALVVTVRPAAPADPEPAPER